MCAECLRASCWHGDDMCAKARSADIKLIRASQLDSLAREHPSHYSRETILRTSGSLPALRALPDIEGDA